MLSNKEDLGSNKDNNAPYGSGESLYVPLSTIVDDKTIDKAGSENSTIDTNTKEGLSSNVDNQDVSPSKQEDEKPYTKLNSIEEAEQVVAQSKEHSVV